MLRKATAKLAGPVLGATVAALVLAATGGATHIGAVQLGHPNNADAQTSITASLTTQAFKVTNKSTGAAIRGDAQSGAGVTGVSLSGVGQLGQSNSGIGLQGIHSAATGASPGVQGVTSSSDPGAAGVVGINRSVGPALRAIVVGTAPPLAVNSSGKVALLNVDLLDGLDSGAFWKLGGNAGTTPGTDFLGTTDNQALEVKVNGQRALRIEPTSSDANILANPAANVLLPGVIGATIAGGGGGPTCSPTCSIVADSYGTISGGLDNFAGNGGGTPDDASFATVGGGRDNQADATFSLVAGGFLNEAVSSESTVGGGSSNIAGGRAATIGGGLSNETSSDFATIPGGRSNFASGGGFAAGQFARADDGGSFVWSDGTAVTQSPAANTFSVRASGGIWLGTTSTPSITAGHFLDTSTGGFLSSAGAWTSSSDRSLKRDFRPVSRESVLRRIGRMPLSSWSYKAETPGVRHIGPTAQAFYRAFGLGLGNKHIAAIDEGGVALAAIQGLYRQNLALQSRVRKLERRLARLSR